MNKKHSRLLWVMVLVAMLILSLSGCGQTPVEPPDDNGDDDPPAETYVMSIAIENVEDHIFTLFLRKFIEYVEAETDQIEFDFQLAGALGNQRELMEQVTLGVMDCTTASSNMIELDDRYFVLEFPFVMRDRAHMEAVVKSDVVAAINEEVRLNEGIRVLVIMENGFRQTTNSVRPIVEPSDFSGVRIRTPENELRMDTFNAFGAAATPISFTELFSAMQQGVVDGQENPLVTILLNHYYEVQKYVSMTNHVYSPGYFLMNEKAFQKYPENLQGIILDAAARAADWQRIQGERFDNEAIADLEARGMEVNVVDAAPFFAIVEEKIVPKYAAYAELIQKIQAIQ